MSDQINDPGTPEQEAPSSETPVSQPSAEPTAEVAEAAPAQPVAEAPEEQPAAEAAPVAVEAAPVVAEQPEPAVAAVAAVPELSEAEKEALAQKKEEERKRKEEEKRQRDESYAALEQLKAAGSSFEVTLKERVKGGLRGEFNGLRVFLPASHCGMRKNVSEDELASLVGQTVTVKVHDLQSDDTGYKSAVITRRDLLADEFWNGLSVGQVFDGVVSSVTTFGAFVNVGGVEGLVHVSRLSKARIEDPSTVVKKGDKLKVTVAEIDRDKKKLSLSHKEHEEDAWKGVNAKFPAGTRVKGTVRRITEFGAYVQVAPRIEGLLRISELSWTRRIKHPSEIVSIGQEVELEVLSANEEAHQLALGYKQTQENPWLTLATTMPVGTEATGIVQAVSTQGLLVRIGENFDGFMPRSKMVGGVRGGKITIEVGQEVSCVIADMNPESSSLILAMKGEDGTIGGQNNADGGQRERGPRNDRGDRGDRRSDERSNVNIPSAPGVTLGDMLKDADKSILRQ